VGIAEQEDDGEPFDEKMKRLTSELSGLFKESHRLEDEIKKQLGSIGFGIECCTMKSRHGKVEK
jgi:type I restriction enzyme M protein